jgi:hypothetical protein
VETTQITFDSSRWLPYRIRLTVPKAHHANNLAILSGIPAPPGINFLNGEVSTDVQHSAGNHAHNSYSGTGLGLLGL